MTGHELNQIRQFIGKLAAENGVDPIHGLDHLRRVAKNARKLNRENDYGLDENLLSAAAYLHELAYFHNHNGVRTWLRERSYLRPYLDRYLPKLITDKKERTILYETIINHNHSFPFHRLNKKKSLYAQILQDADTLDILHTARLRKIKKRYWLALPLIAFAIIILRKKTTFFLNLR